MRQCGFSLAAMLVAVGLYFLLNQSAFLLGVPGSGKSFSAKELMTFLMLNTEDDILVCDPEGEYAPLVEAMGDMGSVIHVSAGGRDRRTWWTAMGRTIPLWSSPSSSYL